MSTTDTATPQDVDDYMGLSYASYLVVPRVMAAQMPREWQERFVALLDEMDESYQHIEHPKGYKVTPGSWEYVCEVPATRRKALGITHSLDDWKSPADDATDEEHEAADAEYRRLEEEGLFYDADGNELTNWDYVFLPGPDPYPGYRHPGDFGPRRP